MCFRFDSRSMCRIHLTFFPFPYHCRFFWRALSRSLEIKFTHFVFLFSHPSYLMRLIGLHENFPFLFLSLSLFPFFLFFFHPVFVFVGFQGCNLYVKPSEPLTKVRHKCGLKKNTGRAFIPFSLKARLFLYFRFVMTCFFVVDCLCWLFVCFGHRIVSIFLQYYFLLCFRERCLMIIYLFNFLAMFRRWQFIFSSRVSWSIFLLLIVNKSGKVSVKW